MAIIFEKATHGITLSILLCQYFRVWGGDTPCKNRQRTPLAHHLVTSFIQACVIPSVWNRNRWPCQTCVVQGCLVCKVWNRDRWHFQNRRYARVRYIQGCVMQGGRGGVIPSSAPRIPTYPPSSVRHGRPCLPCLPSDKGSPDSAHVRSPVRTLWGVHVGRLWGGHVGRLRGETRGKQGGRQGGNQDGRLGGRLGGIFVGRYMGIFRVDK